MTAIEKLAVEISRLENDLYKKKKELARLAAKYRTGRSVAQIFPSESGMNIKGTYNQLDE